MTRQRNDILLLLPAVLIMMLLSACQDTPKDKRLLELYANKVDNNPKETLASLDSIDPASLREADRQFYNLLRIKAQDKAYVAHTSDSVILRLVDYYGSHKYEDLYPEALYYAGRVYSDLGDFPAALKYFQLTISNLSDTPHSENLNLLSRATSQTGRLLANLRIYSNAIPYIEEAISYDSIAGNSLSLMYDCQLLGEIYTNMHQYDKALLYYKKGRAAAETVSPEMSAILDMYIASALYYNHDYRGALSLMRKTFHRLPPEYRSPALSNVGKIYNKVGYRDSAYMCFKELADNPQYFNRSTGYYFLLSPEFENYVSDDSIRNYVYVYRTLLESNLNNNQSQSVMLQQSFYNYSLKEQAALKAKHHNTVLILWLTMSLLIVLLLFIVLIVLRNRNMENNMQLELAIADMERLKRNLEDSRKINGVEAGNEPSNLNGESDNSVIDSEAVETDSPDNSSPGGIPQTCDRDKSLKEKLRTSLFELQKSSQAPLNPPNEILNSEVYQKLMEMIRGNKVLGDRNSLWLDLEQLILTVCPGFRDRLMLLTGHNLTTTDWHMALLIKCHVTPTQMTTLISKTKGTISSRRATICKKVFDKNIGVAVIDNIIRLL